MTMDLEIWDFVKTHEVEYDWPVGAKARARLAEVLGSEIAWPAMGSGAQQNRELRLFVNSALRAHETDAARAAALYQWIVCDWGGVKAGRDTVESWASPEFGWHGAYDEATLGFFIDQMGSRRVSSWSKIFAFAAPDRHAIYDSRVAVALNLAMEHLGQPQRFVMPASKVYVDRNGEARPNAVARARERLHGRATFGYRDYLRWVQAVQDGTAERGDAVDILTIESTLFATAPAMAEKLTG